MGFQRVLKESRGQAQGRSRGSLVWERGTLAGAELQSEGLEEPPGGAEHGRRLLPLCALHRRPPEPEKLGVLGTTSSNPLSSTIFSGRQLGSGLMSQPCTTSREPMSSPSHDAQLPSGPG